MKQHSKNAQYLAENFEKMGMKIIYPGLKSHPQYKILKKMMYEEFGFGGILAYVKFQEEHENKKEAHQLGFHLCGFFTSNTNFSSFFNHL